MSSLFATLPVELHHRIASYSDIDCLSRLSQTSRAFYEYYNSFLYQNVNTAALPTLALSQEDRFPLTSPHPVTFLTSMRIVGEASSPGSNAMQIEAKRLEKQTLVATMVNILKYAPTNRLRSFTFKHLSADLLEVLTADSARALSSLESLVISCLFPYYITEAGDKRLWSLCGPSLTRLELEVTEDGYSAAALLKKLPELCPKLEIFVCSVDDSQMNGIIQSLLYSPTFTFPFLVEFSVMLRVRCPECFLRRHPNLRVFRWPYSVVEPIGDSTILPNLTHFTSDVETFFRMLMHGTQAINRLVLKMDGWNANTVEGLVQYLRRNTTIRHLILQPPGAGFKLDIVLSLITSSPNLTTFGCSLTTRVTRMEDINPVYETILGNLPYLEHLKLWLDIDYANVRTHEPFRTRMKLALQDYNKQAIQSAIMIHDHRTLKTIRLKVYLAGISLQEMNAQGGVNGFINLWFAREVPYVVVSVPKKNMQTGQAEGLMLDYGFDDLDLNEL